MGILITFKSRSDKAGYPTFEAMVIGVANMVSISSSCNSMCNMVSILHNSDQLRLFIWQVNLTSPNTK